MADTDGWEDSPCADLADAAASFHLITSIPRARSLASVEAEHPSPLALLYDDRSVPHSFRLDRLHHTAHSRLQACLTDLVSTHILDANLSSCSNLACCRIGSCSLSGAAELFLLFTLPPEVRLDDFALAVLIRHRLGLPLLGLLEPEQLTRCCATCRRVPLRADDPDLGYAWPHAYHQMGCGLDRHRIARHEAIHPRRGRQGVI